MRKLTLSLAVLAALLPGRANTLGLGELELNSALNQELDAEIEVLSAAPEDAEQMLIRLASREAFARAGIDRPYLLQQLKFEIVTRDGKPFIKVSTKSPIREPFLSFLVEIDWPEGHLLREYTVLLDPPVYSGVTAGASPAEMESGGRPFIDPADVQAQPQSASPQQDYSRPAASAYMAPAPGASQGAASLPVTPPVTIRSADSGRQATYQPMTQYREVSGSYRVQQDDTLWSLANKLRPDSSISVEQMMLALVRNNPEAFIKENIHGIKRGYILRMPERSAITSIDRQAALAQVREHTALWREYRQALSGAAPASAMEADMSASAEGISEQPGAGQLSIVAASGDEGGDTATAGQDPRVRELNRLRNELSLAQESLESERLEKETLQARLADLEQRVQRAIELGDADLAALQQELQGAQQAMEESAPEPVAEAEPEPMAEDMPAEMPEQSMMEPAVTEQPDEELASPAEETMPAEGEPPVFVDETAPAEETMEQAPVEPAVPAVKPADVPAFARPESTGLLDKLFNDPKLLAAAGAGLMAILALIGLLLRRLRKGKDEDEWVADNDLGAFDDADMGESTLATPAVEAGDSTAEMQAAGFDDTQMEAPDDSGGQLEDTVMTLANEASAPEAEKDDVLAEADVYLAYGIYQQAEELLNKAIGEHPERDDYRMKLLETHFASKNADAFAQLAEDVQQRKAGDRQYWDRVQVMGRELCPSHALFSADSAELPGLDGDDLLPKKPETTDLELDAGEDELSADLDLGFEEDSDQHQATQMLSEPLDLGEAAETDDDELGLAADLESLSNEIEAADELEPAAGSSSDEEDEGLEFDLGDFETDMQETEQAASTGESDELDMDDDFSLDFEASDLGFETDEEETGATAEAEPELDADLDLGIAMDEAEEAGGELELDMDMDLGGEIDLDEGSADLDLDADIDLAGAETEPSLDMASASNQLSSMDDDDFDISELSEDVDEVTTKLDLARAYIDMGDNEGARSILEEVKQEGNEDQQAQASELLQQAS